MLIPDRTLNGQFPGEDSALASSMVVDWKFGGMFLADNERYDAEPTRVTLEKSALRILQVLRRAKKKA